MNHDPIMSTGRDRKTWTAKEDEQLRNAVLQTIQDSRPLMWRDLAKSVPGRSNKDCRRRWWNTLAGCTVKGPWSESEDERLMHAVGSYGPQWTQVAAAVGTRHSDQCSSHWTQVLDPDINHSDFTPDEVSHDTLHPFVSLDVLSFYARAGLEIILKPTTHRIVDCFKQLSRREPTGQGYRPIILPDERPWR
ncbi:Homeodomain-like protein [Ustulina deusta]|nr:Homeodomain-like protein [Ustulina deusta]